MVAAVENLLVPGRAGRRRYGVAVCVDEPGSQDAPMGGFDLNFQKTVRQLRSGYTRILTYAVRRARSIEWKGEGSSDDNLQEREQMPLAHRRVRAGLQMQMHDGSKCGLREVGMQE